MADPLSITSGVFALVMSALQAAQQTKAFIDGIRGAPRAVHALSSDLAALSNVLGTLENFLQNINNGRNPNQARLVGILQSPLNNCMKSLHDIKGEIEPFVKPLSGISTSKWKAFVWTFREKDVIALQRSLMSSQSLLDSAVAVVTLSSSTHEFTTIRRTMNRGFGYDRESVGDSGFAGSDVAGTDYGYAMRRFILDDDTVVEESPPLSPVLEEAKDPFEVHESDVVTPVEDPEPTDEWWRPPPQPQKVAPPVRPRGPGPGLEAKRISPPPPQPPHPTRDRTITILRKTIVSPAALREKKIKFTEEGDKYVEIMRNLEKAEVDALRARSLEINKDTRRWWSTPTAVQAPPAIPHPPQQRIIQAEQRPGEITLRKTIVSEAALREQNLPFKESGKYVTVLRELDGAEVKILRERSVQLEVVAGDANHPAAGVEAGDASHPAAAFEAGDASHPAAAVEVDVQRVA
ncbi:hypothetical protein MMC30_000505 [Trapelia coarctata]|nr:hypothetical protein [Trapelia coarctata]